ncbi:MFS transporter [soil metagenome]
MPAYRRIWSAAVVSNVGTFLQLTAAPWLMNELTGSPLLVALVTTALTLPRLLFTLPAGVLSDAFDRRTLMISGQLISATAVAVMAMMAFTGSITPAWLLGLSFVLGTGTAINLPSFQTLVPDLVGPNLRAQAITLNSAAFNVARAVGPSLGGVLVAAGLTSGAFAANAVSFLAVVAVLLSFPRQQVEGDAGRHLWRAAATGVRYARFTQPIRVLLVIAALFAVTAVSVQALLPNVVSDDLGLGPSGFGLLYGAFGAGALAAAFTRDRGRAVFGRRMLPGSIAAFGAMGVVFGLSSWPVVSALALAVAGGAWVWTLTTLNATIQTLAPRWVRGRVVSLYLLAVGLQPLGAVVSGALAEGVGAGRAVAVACVVTAGLGLVASRLVLPVLGEIDEPVAPPEDFSVAPHASRVAGSPVVVATTWQVDPDDLDAFLATLRELRRERFRTGARRWSLYRDADRPYRITEMFTVADWDEHLAQHGRIDATAATVLTAAQSFDRDGCPVTRHLVGLDIVDIDREQIDAQLLTVHSKAHRRDGSVPLQ